MCSGNELRNEIQNPNSNNDIVFHAIGLRYMQITITCNRY
jgi:hypothetical protein